MCVLGDKSRVGWGGGGGGIKATIACTTGHRDGKGGARATILGMNTVCVCGGGGYEPQ